jgi:EF-hand domain
MAAPIKMDELLVTWLGSDEVYENVLNLIEKYRVQRQHQQNQKENGSGVTPPGSPKQGEEKETESVPPSPRGVTSIPPFYPLKTPTGATIQRRRKLPRQSETWEPLPADTEASNSQLSSQMDGTTTIDGIPLDEILSPSNLCVRDQVTRLLEELGIIPPSDDMSASPSPPPQDLSNITLPLEVFIRITKEVCHFPSFFNGPLYQRMLDLWNAAHEEDDAIDAVTIQALEWYWKQEMEPYDPPERFFRLIKQPDQDCILRDDFLSYIKALLNDHPVR